jgi:hypothetical protein
MYGCRNLYSCGRFEGKIDRRVINIGSVWYGRKVMSRKEALRSWTLE